jgi:branched-chain amino acid transport system permease protein
MSKKTLSVILFCCAVIALMVFLPVMMPGPYILQVLVFTVINIVLAVSFRLINLTGQMSLAHGGMMMIGAYTGAILVTKLGFSSWLSLLLAGVAAAIIACLIGFPFTRLKGIYFSMVTIFLAQIATLFIQQLKDITGGNQGIFGIPKPDPIIIPGILNIDFTPGVNQYYLLVVIAVISLVTMWAIERSRVGLTFMGIRQSESLGESLGINATGYKVLAFTIGSFFAGIIGGFYSQYLSTVSTSTFNFIFTINILIYMMVGGEGKFIGPIIGAVILTLLPEVARPLKSYTTFVFAGVLMVIIFLLPEGLVSLPKRFGKYSDSLAKIMKKFGAGKNA